MAPGTMTREAGTELILELAFPLIFGNRHQPDLVSVVVPTGWTLTPEYLA